MLAAGLAAQVSSSSQLRHKRELRTHAQVNGAAELMAAASHFLHIEAKTYKSQHRAMVPTIWHYSYTTYYMTPGKGGSSHYYNAPMTRTDMRAADYSTQNLLLW